MAGAESTSGDRPQRIVVHGASGSGKTTLASNIATQLDYPHLELDSLYHQAQWTSLEVERFRELVTDFAQRPVWVCDGNYRQVRDFLWSRCDTIVILDLPRLTVMRQLATRTLRRLVKSEKLWHGNRESWRNIISANPEKNILLWSWSTHQLFRDQIPREARDHRPPVQVIVLRSHPTVSDILEERSGS